MSQDLPELLERFDELQRRIASYELALGLMYYDNQTSAPAAGAHAHGQAEAVLYEAQHALQCGPEAGEIVARLAEHQNELDPLHRAEARVFSRTYAQDSRIPAQLASDYKRLTTEAFQVWRSAKANDDFASFEPYLDRIFVSLREQAQCIDPQAHPYDVWLDRWEPGCSIEVCDRFFDEVKASVTPLVHAIGELPVQPEPAWVHAPVPARAQQELANDLAQAIGLDPARLTFGLTEHPFTISFDRDDVRIAHHYQETNVLDSVATTVHEGGHALYEQSVDPKYSFTCLHGGASAGLHESQSRLMENMVGRSRPFMDVLLPLLQRHAPTFADATPEELYRACNAVRPSLVRMGADELTYPLHILVRYECEKQLITGSIAAKDIPGLWHDLMLEHLGIEVPNDTLGCLQDMHWSSDFVGYFTSYALGNAYAAQFVHHARQAYDGDVDAAVASGDVTPITGWLKQNVWQHGASLDPQDLIAQACGEPFDPAYYTRYLASKFGKLYGIEGL